MAGNSDWRPVAAALNHAQTRTVWARLVLGESPADAVADLPAGRARQVLATLARTGLTVDGPDGTPVVSETVFADLLGSAAPPPRRGVERFLSEGRVVTFPATQTDRFELFSSLVGQVLAPGEEVDETELNERLGRHDHDVARLRRYLVDAGLLERARDGSVYARPPAAPMVR